jgi:hypothetical protein
MTKIYFNANNKAHLETLKACGVKNVLLSYKYSYANIKKFHGNFDSIMVVAGIGSNEDKYHDWLRAKKEYYDYATQFDVYYDMEKTIKHWEKEKKEGIDWTLPVLQGNYLHHISRIRPKTGSYVCLGEIRGKFETEDQMRKLPANLKFHGLAKGKFIQDRKFHSIDTSAWVSGAMSKKTEVWNANTTYSMFFGQKGRGMVPMLRHSCDVYKENMEKLDIDINDVIDAEYYSLLKIPIALLFMPMCKSLNMYEENFNI